MSSEKPSTITDQQSERVQRRGRPPVPRDQVVRAARALFADSDAPSSVSMDDIAAAAGVGKGTLFRAFGSRDGLLDAIFADQLGPLQTELQRPDSPVGPRTPPVQRILAILDLLLTFKLENSRLVAARELDGSSPLRAPHYRWVHTLLADLITQLGSATDAAYTAHVLLGSVRSEVVTDLVASGCTGAEISAQLRGITLRLIEPSES